MNGKQAKRLRRAAAGLAVTLTEAGKDIKKDGYVVKTHRKMSPSSMHVDEFDPKGVLPKNSMEKEPQPVMPSYQIKVRQDSYKGIYKMLKAGKA